MRATRFALVAAGALVLGWGIWLMLSRQDLDQLTSAAVWLIAVVVVHDGAVAAIGAVRHRRRRSHHAGESNEGSL